MSNERNRIAGRTAANANILSTLGDILSSDGIQAMRIPLGTPGQVLSVDLTAECGIAWADGGGGVTLTFSDGVTRTVNNVTNDLVTGTAVAEVDAVATDGMTFTSAADVIFDVTSGDITLGTNQAIALNAQGGASGQLALNTTTGDCHITMSGAAASTNRISITANGTGANGTVIVTGTSTVQISGGASGVQLTTSNSGDINLNSNLGINLNAVGGFDAQIGASAGITAGDNIVFTAGGSANGNATIDAGFFTETGEVALMPRAGAPAATLTFRIWNGDGAGQIPFIEAAGGATVDAESRAAIATLSNALVAWGWMAPQT